MLARRYRTHQVANVHYLADHLMANRLALTHGRNAAHETDVEVAPAQDQRAHQRIEPGFNYSVGDRAPLNEARADEGQLANYFAALLSTTSGTSK